MNAGIAGHAGTPQLKQFLMVNIKTEFPRGISDQVISFRAATAGTSVHPGPGQQPQASSTKLLEPQATSVKPQAQRLKLQATSNKLLDPGPFVKFHGTRTEGLNADE